MVRHDQDGVGLPGLLKAFQQGAHNLRIDQLNGADLPFQVPVVSALVRRLHMDIHQVLALQQGIQGCLALAAEIGVNVAGGAFHFDDLHSGAETDALD